MKKRLFVLLLITAFVFILAGCSSDTEKNRTKKSDPSTSSREKDPEQSEEKNGKSDITNILSKIKEDDKDDKDGNTATPAPVTDEPDKSGKDGGKKNRNLVTKYYELVSIDGHTRDEFQSDPDLCSDYGAWEFAEYGAGIVVDFDYDTGSVQYTWESITQNAYSTASVDNPSGTMDILAFSFAPGEDIGRSEVWDTVDVQYTDEAITVTYSGGCVEIYEFRSSE